MAQHPRVDRRILLVAAVAGVAVALPVLLGAVASGRNGRDENRARVEKLGSVERRKIEDAAREFHALPKNRQEAYRKLHRDLQADARDVGGLNDVMQEYKTWLKKISPWEREELRRKSDVTERVRLVREIKARQRTEESSSSRPQVALLSPGGTAGNAPAGHDGPPGPPPGAPPDGPRKLTAAEFQAMIVVIHASLPEAKRKQYEAKKRSEQPDELRKCQLAVISSALIASEQAGVPVDQWPGEQLFGELLTRISDPRFRDEINNHPHFEGRTRHLRHLLMLGLYDSWKPVLEKIRPDDQKLEEMFVSLNENQQQELTGLTPGERRKRLAAMYFLKNRIGSRGELAEFQKVTQKLGSGERRPITNFQRLGPGGRPRPGMEGERERGGPRRPGGPRGGPGGRPGGPGERGGGPSDGERPPPPRGERPGGDERRGPGEM